jgi:hypothetical protein
MSLSEAYEKWKLSAVRSRARNRQRRSDNSMPLTIPNDLHRFPAAPMLPFVVSRLPDCRNIADQCQDGQEFFGRMNGSQKAQVFKGLKFAVSYMIAG